MKELTLIFKMEEIIGFKQVKIQGRFLKGFSFLK